MLKHLRLFTACFATGLFSLLASSANAQFSSSYFSGNSDIQQLGSLVSESELNAFLPKDDEATEAITFSYNASADFTAMDVRSFGRMYAEETGAGRRSFMNTIAETPGLAFLSSAILPGFGQAANQQWWKTALFAGVEITTLYLMIDYRNTGDRWQRDYNQYADDHWSVVQYAQFVVNYTQVDASMADVVTEAGMQELMNNGFIRPTFNNDIDWAMIDLGALNELEFNTLYRSTGRPFSHVVPAYGSQQYYELPSKYFQYGPGWRDWNRDMSIIDGGIDDMPASWRYHTALEEDFNDMLRYSRNMGMLLIANHVVSAFDALFTSQLRNHRRNMETSAALMPGGNPGVQVSYKF